jgi:hypothetical protein
VQSIRISLPVFLGVGVKNDVQAFYIYDAEVVKMASSLLPIVSLHRLDLLPSAATFFVFVGVHHNDLSHPCFHSAFGLLWGFRPVELMVLLTRPILAVGNCSGLRWADGTIQAISAIPATPGTPEIQGSM